MKTSSLGYILRTSRFDQFWFPAAFWALFVIIAVIRGEAYIVDTTRAYIGAVVPLIAGLMAAYAVLDDPALELRFATPISAAQTLAECLVPTLFVMMLSAQAYLVFAFAWRADFSFIGSWVDLQMCWLVPGLALLALGSLSALASAQTATGAVLTGMFWIVELVARGWFAGNKIGQYLLVFMSPFMSDHPALHANQLILLILSVGMFVLAWVLFHRQERYI